VVDVSDATANEGFDPAVLEDEREEPTALPSEAREGEPDVLLDVPELRVEEISLDVEDLQARVSLQADVLQLLKLHVGAEAALGRVQLTIKGVEARAVLKVHLDNVARILDRVLTTIDNNPDLVAQLVEPVGGAVEEVGAGAGEAVEEVGQTAGPALGEVASDAGSAVAGAGDVAGRAVEGLGEGVGRAADEVTGDDRPRRRPERGPQERPRRRPAPSSKDRPRPSPARRPPKRRSEEE
jgi:hypothetical protein